MSNQERTYDMDAAALFVGKSRRTFELWLKESKTEPDFLEPTGKSRPKALFTETTLRELMKQRGILIEDASETISESVAVTEDLGADFISGTISETGQKGGLARVEVPPFIGDFSTFVGIIAGAVAQSLPQPQKESIADLSVMPFLSFAQAHRLYNVPEQHIRDAVKSGELKARKLGRGQQVRSADVRAWLEAKFEN